MNIDAFSRQLHIVLFSQENLITDFFQYVTGLQFGTENLVKIIPHILISCKCFWKTTNITSTDVSDQQVATDWPVWKHIWSCFHSCIVSSLCQDLAAFQSIFRAVPMQNCLCYVVTEFSSILERTDEIFWCSTNWMVGHKIRGTYAVVFQLNSRTICSMSSEILKLKYMTQTNENSITSKS